MQILNIGIIGTGGIGWAHARGLLASAGRFRIRAASDTNAQGLERFCAEFGIAERHADYRRLLADPAIDAVLVLLPHHLHAEVCAEAFAAGKHVLLEKPIARTLAEADHIIAAARRHRRLLMIGHNQRYDGRHRGIRRLLDAGVIGEVFSARIDHFQHFNPPAASWWRSQEQVGGGCVIGSGIHRLDLLRWYLGEAQEVYAQLSWDPTRLEGEVACSAILRFHGGATAEFLCNWGVHRAVHGESLMLFGRQGSVSVSGGEPGTTFLPPGHQPAVLADDPVSMWDHFHDCVLSGAEPLTSGAEGRASLQLVLAVVEAGRSGVPLRLAADGSVQAPSAPAAEPSAAQEPVRSAS